MEFEEAMVARGVVGGYGLPGEIRLDVFAVALVSIDRGVEHRFVTERQMWCRAGAERIKSPLNGRREEKTTQIVKVTFHMGRFGTTSLRYRLKAACN